MKISIALIFCLCGFSQTLLKQNFDVRGYGAKCDGSTDDTAAVQRAINSAGSSGGGAVVFPLGTLGTCKMLGQLTIPDDGASPWPHQVAIRLTGSVGYFSGIGTGPIGGSILDMRYAGAGAGKIYSRGIGTLEIDHLTITDGGSDTVPYVYATNTTLLIHHAAFWGNPGKGGGQATPDQDAIILGGTSTSFGNGTNAPFQGYGTVIQDNYFNRMRRAVYGRTFANGVVIRDNTIWNESGGAAGTAAIEWLGNAGQICAGGLIEGNLIEMGGYTHGIRIQNAGAFTVIGNNFYDSVNGLLVTDILLDTAAQTSLVIAGVGDVANGPYLTDNGVDNSFITSQLSQTTKFFTPVSVTGALTAGNEIVANGGTGLDVDVTISSAGAKKWGMYWNHGNDSVCFEHWVDSTQPVCVDSSGHLGFKRIAFASLGAVPLAGYSVYCSDCTTAATCAGAGSGHLAVSNGTNWTCQ